MYDIENISTYDGVVCPKCAYQSSSCDDYCGQCGTHLSQVNDLIAGLKEGASIYKLADNSYQATVISHSGKTLDKIFMEFPLALSWILDN